jgi:hypothetical protein
MGKTYDQKRNFPPSVGYEKDHQDQFVPSGGWIKDVDGRRLFPSLRLF